MLPALDESLDVRARPVAGPGAALEGVRSSTRSGKKGRAAPPPLTL